MTLKGKTILFFAGPLYEDLELWYPKIRLEEEGARTVVAGTGEKTYQGKRGYPLTVDTSVDQLEAKDFGDRPIVEADLERLEALVARHQGGAA